MENWTSNLLPSRQFGCVSLISPDSAHTILTNIAWRIASTKRWSGARRELCTFLSPPLLFSRLFVFLSSPLLACSAQIDLLVLLYLTTFSCALLFHLLGSPILALFALHAISHIVLTTSKGIMTHDEARKKHTGGKILGFFY